MNRCPICKVAFSKYHPDLVSTQNTLVFLYTEPLPYRMNEDAYAAIKHCFVVDKRQMVKAHVECCFDLKPQAPMVNGPVVLRVIKKSIPA